MSMGVSAFAAIADTDVAKIGETGYATLQGAIDGAVAGDEIVLLKDVALTDGLEIAADDEIVLDLAGFTLSYTSSEETGNAAITNKGTLTVKDEAGTGKITYESSKPSGGNKYATNTITNSGTLTVKSGTIENTTATGASYAIDNNSTTGDAIITIDGGTVEAMGVAIRVFANSGTYVNTVTVNDGKVEGKRAIFVQLPGEQTDRQPEVTLDINGGSLIATGEAGGYKLAIYSYSFGNSYENVTINISEEDGAKTVVSGDVAVGGGSVYGGSGAETVNISGGTVTDVYTYNKNAHDIEITGGIFEYNPDPQYLGENVPVASLTESGAEQPSAFAVGTDSIEELSEEAEEGDVLTITAAGDGEFNIAPGTTVVNGTDGEDITVNGYTVEPGEEVVAEPEIILPTFTPSTSKPACDHEFDEDGVCEECGVKIITNAESKPTEGVQETNPNTGAESAVAVVAAVAVLSGAAALCLGKRK